MPQMRPFSQFCNAETPLVQAKQLFVHRENPTGKNVDIVSFWCIDRGRVHFSFGSGSGCRALLRLAEALFFTLLFKAQVKFFIPLLPRPPPPQTKQPRPGSGKPPQKANSPESIPFFGNRNAKARKRPPGFPSGGMRRRSPFMRGEPGQAMQSAEVSQPLPSRRGDLLFKLSQKATGEVSPLHAGRRKRAPRRKRMR